MHTKVRSVSLALLAVAFAGGIHAAPMLPPMPMSWLAAALCVVAIGGSSRRGALLAVCFLVGGARASADRTGERAVVPDVDDRVVDVIRGIVAGPVQDRPSGAQFLVRMGAPGSVTVLVTVRDRARSPVLPGDEVVVSARLRTPRGFLVAGAVDVKTRARIRGADLVASAPASAIQRVGETWSTWRSPAMAQRWMSDQIASRNNDATATTVVRAMVAGDRVGVDYQLADRFRRAGASHLLAVSGLHLAVVTLLLFAAVRRMWAAVPALTHRIRAPVVASMVAWPAAVGYTCSTGARVSTLRALLVISIVLLGIVLVRRARVVDALGVAAVALLALSPATLYDPSFQLSFAATAVLCLAVKGAAIGATRSPLQRFMGYAAGLVRASLWATLATAPLTALAFGSVAPGGIVSNLVVVPVTELIVLPLGLIGVMVSVVSPTVGGLAIDVAVIGAEVVMWVVDLVGARAPVYQVPAPRWWELIACGVGIGIGIAWTRSAVGWRASVAGLAAVAVTLAMSWALTAVVLPGQRSSLQVTFVDVGQGDAAVLEFPGGGVWLIDSGGRPFVVGRGSDDAERSRRLAQAPGEMAVVRYLSHRRITRLDRVIITHPHPDHYVGLAAVARSIDIGEVWIPEPHADRPEPLEFSLLMWQLRLTGTQIVNPRIGVHDVGGVRVHVLHPHDAGPNASADPALGFNDNSLVVRIDFGGRRLLFLGDVETEAEEILVREIGRDALRADVVKVPHHGSRTSSGQALVDAATPGWAIISCGVANRFRFPAEEVVARWRAAGTKVLRTDLRGSITVTVDPSGDLRVRASVGAASSGPSGRTGSQP